MCATRLMVLLVVLCSTLPALARMPTTQEVVVSARQAALEAKSREAMVKVAELTREIDPEQALRDYQAAVQIPLPPEAGLRQRVNLNYRIAKALAELGDSEGARQLLEATLSSLKALEPPRPSRVHRWHWDQVYLLMGPAELIYPLDPEEARQAVELAGTYLEKAEQEVKKLEASGRRVLPPHMDRQMAYDWYAIVLAHFDPEEAYRVFDTKLKSHGSTARFVRNLIKADLNLVMAHFEELLKARGSLRHLWYDRRGLRAEVKGELVAALLRRDPVRALEAALELEMGDCEGSPERKHAWRHAADTIREMGLNQLPTANEYEPCYRWVAPQVAKLDPQMGLALAARVTSPQERGETFREICSTLLPDRLPHAREAARRVIETSDGGQHPLYSCLYYTAYALAPYDTEVMPELLKRMAGDHRLRKAFGLWRQHHPQAAEALLEIPRMIELKKSMDNEIRSY